MLEIIEKTPPKGRKDESYIHITEATDGDKLGFISYAYKEDRTIIYDFEYNGDIMFCDGLVRSVILKSCLKGIDNIELLINDVRKYTTLERLGFITEGSRRIENAGRFMNGCENCKNQ